MMCQTCSETAGTVGAADVYVESGLEAQVAQLSNTNGKCFRG